MLKDSINSYINKNLTPKRQKHTEGVRQTAIELAEKYGCDVQKAELAALLHDMARCMPDDVKNYYVKHLNLPERYKDNGNLSHSKIAAVMMQKEFGIHDEDMINAVSYHTTGRPGMSLLEKIVYLADAVEPGRMYPGVEELRKAAFEDIDVGCLKSLQHTIDFIEGEKKFLDDDTILAKEYFENLIKEKKENTDD